MNSQTASALRTLLTLLGAYLVGNSIFGVPFTSETIDIVVGGAFAGISVLVGVFTKNVQQEAVQSFVRHLITFACGIILSKGIVSQDMLTAILALIGSVSPWLQSVIQISANKGLQDGKIKAADLKS